MTLFAQQVSRSNGAAEVEGRQAGARGGSAFSPVHGRDIGEKGEFLGPIMPNSLLQNMSKKEENLRKI